MGSGDRVYLWCGAEEPFSHYTGMSNHFRTSTEVFPVSFGALPGQILQTGRLGGPRLSTGP